MKKRVVFLFFLCSCVSGFSDQRTLGEEAPSFQVQTATGKIHFPEDFSTSWTLLISFPNVMTPVCSLELKKCIMMWRDWKRLHVRCLVVTPHDNDQQQAWLQNICQNLENAKIHIMEEHLPLLLPDPEKIILEDYGMIHPSISTIKPIRAIFIIDPKGKIRSISYYPMKNGRNFAEVARLVAALQKTDENSAYTTPPDWKEGESPLTCAPCSQGVK